MHIDWATLGTIAVVSAGTALATVLLVSLALVGLSARPGPADDRRAGGTAFRRATGGTVVAGLCLLSAGFIVCYGLYLIIA